MKAALQDSGWSMKEHLLPVADMEQLVKKKNEVLETAMQEVQAAFNVKFGKFDSDKAECIELAKGITRSFLRYDNSSFLLARAILKELHKTYGLSEQLNYFTLPYPIIHFSYDTSEIGPKHKDGYDYIEHFYTTWTPLNDCFHKPLSITENSHKKNGFILRQLRARIKFIDKAVLATKKIIYPDIPLGNFLLWHGATDHEGLLNTSKDITTTLVVRFTSSPVLYDVAISCDDLLTADLNESGIDTRYFTKRMIALFKEVDAFAKKEDEEKSAFGQFLENINGKIKEWDLTPAEWKRFAFVLGLWAQRMESKRNVFVFYLFAFTGAHDNFYVLQKCIGRILAVYGKKEAQQFINTVVEKYPGRQMNHVVESALAIAGEKAEGIKVNYPAYAPILTHRFE
jgi:hypothetical protein